MTEIRFFILLTLILSGCSTSNIKDVSDKTPAASNSVSEKKQFNHYSDGLHFKNLAGETADPEKKKEYLSSALNSFGKATEDNNKNLDLVYNQLSECYLLSGEYTRSIEYAERSIEINNTSVDPYLRIYTISITFKKMKEAAEILTQYLSVDPASVHIQFVLSDHYLRNLEDLQSAESGFQKVLELNNSNSTADYYTEYSHYYLGYIFYMKKQYDRSLFHFRKVLEINKSNSRSVSTLAFIYMELNKISEAEKYAVMALKNDNQNKKIHGVLGRVYYIKNDSRSSFHLQMALNDEGVDALLARALYFEKTGNHSSAAKILTAIKKTNPKLVTTYIASGKILASRNNFISAAVEYSKAGTQLYEAGQYSEAVYYLLKSIEMNPSLESYYYLARSYEDSGNYSSAIIYYKRVLEIEPSTDVKLQIAMLTGFKNRFNDAFRIISDITISEPENSKAYFIAGILYFKQEDYINAEKYISTAISLYEEIEIFHYYMAAIYEKTGRLEDAIESLKSAIKYNPASGRSFNFLGYLYADNNIHLDDSYSLIIKALEIEPENGAYIDSLGWVYYKKGNYQKALEKLLEAEKIMGNFGNVDPAVYDHIGDTYEKIGNTRMAIIYWNKSLIIEDNAKIKEKIIRYEEK